MRVSFRRVAISLLLVGAAACLEMPPLILAGLPAVETARAQGVPAEEISDTVESQVGRRVRIELEDGTTIAGVVRSETADQVTVESPTLGTVTVSRAHIKRLVVLPPSADDGTGGDPAAPASSSAYWPTDPDYNSLLFVPTSETLEKGDSYYRNFELLFNNFGISPTDYLSLSFMAAFPITSDFTIFSFGTKVRLLSRERSPVGFAVAGSATFGNEVSFQNYSAIASVGNKRHSVTAVANLGVGENDTEPFFLLGGDVQIAPRVKLLAEVGNSATAIDDDFNGVLNVGFRAFWDRVSFTLTAFRPLEEGLDELIAFPFASFSAHF